MSVPLPPDIDTHAHTHTHTVYLPRVQDSTKNAALSSRQFMCKTFCEQVCPHTPFCFTITYPPPPPPPFFFFFFFFWCIRFHTDRRFVSVYQRRKLVPTVNHARSSLAKSRYFNLSIKVPNSLLWGHNLWQIKEKGSYPDSRRSSH